MHSFTFIAPLYCQDAAFYSRTNVPNLGFST
jgi:hypothetical protein